MSLSIHHRADSLQTWERHGARDEARPILGSVPERGNRLLADRPALDAKPHPLSALDVLSQLVVEPVLPEAINGREATSLRRLLTVAVPIWIIKANAGCRRDDGLLLAWRNQADLALCRAEELVFGRRTRAEADRLLTDFARGMAAKAFQPGGVALGDVVFCALHAPSGTNRATTGPRCPRCPTTQQFPSGARR